MITVVLVEPATSGNVGAIARAMKNFGFDDLVLINPKCNHLDLDAMSRSKHAKDVLRNAKVYDFAALKKFDYLIGTTAMIGNDYNIPRCPITPEQLVEIIPKKGNIALIFGRDTFGLTNQEIQMCDFVVTIPTHKKYPTLNLSHSASIIFYELFKKFGSEKVNSHIQMATKKEKEIILQFLNKRLDTMLFQTPEKKETQRILWKRLIGKSFLTKREAFALIGFFKKLN